jgi:hypothetical protein
LGERLGLACLLVPRHWSSRPPILAGLPGREEVGLRAWSEWEDDGDDVDAWLMDDNLAADNAAAERSGEKTGPLETSSETMNVVVHRGSSRPSLKEYLEAKARQPGHQKRCRLLRGVFCCLEEAAVEVLSVQLDMRKAELDRKTLAGSIEIVGNPHLFVRTVWARDGNVAECPPAELLALEKYILRVNPAEASAVWADVGER